MRTGELVKVGNVIRVVRFYNPEPPKALTLVSHNAEVLRYPPPQRPDVFVGLGIGLAMLAWTPWLALTAFFWTGR